MSKVRSKDTQLELLIRKALFRKGYRYRLQFPILGKPDIVFPRMKTAIFINGCFWHQHVCNKAKRPVGNADFWNNKLDKNIERDNSVRRQLNHLGWETYYIWECEVKKDITIVIDNLTKFLNEKSNNTR